MRGCRYDRRPPASRRKRPRHAEACGAFASARTEGVAGADLDGHRPGAAVPARRGRGARRAAAAAQPQRVQGPPVHRRPPDAGAVAGPAAVVRRVLQLLVHRHLRAAVRLAGGLSDPAHRRASAQPSGRPGARAAQPGPAAQTRRGRRHRHARTGVRPHLLPPARMAEDHPAGRRRHRDLRGEGLPARVRQHRLPLLPARPAGRHRGGQAVRVRGQCHRDRQRRARFLLGLPGGLRLVPRGQQRRRHQAVPDVRAGQRFPGRLSAVRSGHVVCGRYRLPGRGRPDR